MSRFVILITGHNTEKWVGRCLLSALSQEHHDFRVIMTEDASTDWTPYIAEALNLWVHLKYTNFEMVVNTVRQGALANYAHMLEWCEPDEIAVLLDGDDQLAHRGVLAKLEEIYADPSVWTTYGSYDYDKESRMSDEDCRGIAAQIPPDDHTRATSWCATHLRTFKVWLYRKIKSEDLLYNGEFYKVAWDLPLMYPMLEMAGPAHARFVPDVLYLYNLVNQINDCRVYSQDQINEIVRHVKAQPIYPLLEGSS